MRYRIEVINVPDCRRQAGPEDEALDLPGRRIIHVFGSAPSEPSRLRVLIEEADPAPPPRGVRMDLTARKPAEWP